MNKAKTAPNSPSVGVSATSVTKGPTTRKPYEEISVLFNGNEIKIRVPKATSKTNNPYPQKDQCICSNDSVCSLSCGVPLEDTGGCAYEMTGGGALNNNMMCSVCNVTPTDAPKGVVAEKVLHPEKDVFLLKIGKQTDEPNRTGNIEVELVTPRGPAKKKPASHAIKHIQVDINDLPCCAPCKPDSRKRKSRRVCCRY